MSKVEDLINLALRTGYMTEEEHEEVMQLVQEDGEIDEAESAELSRLFAAIEGKKIKVLRNSRQAIEQSRKEAESARLQTETQRTELEQASHIGAIIDRAIAQGVISAKEHELLLKQIHADGRIDETEKKLLSRLFSAMQSGALRLIEENQSVSPERESCNAALEQAKQEALARDQKSEFASSTKSKNADIADVPNEISPETEDNEGPIPELETVNEPKEKRKSALETVKQTSVRATTFDSAIDPLNSFVSQLKGRRQGGRNFELQNDRLLDVNLNGKVWIKTGTMVAYYGLIKFTREGYAEHGVTKMIKKAVTGEGTNLTKATGQGNLYLAEQGKKISIIEVGGSSLIVNGKNILAFEETVNWDISYLRAVAAVWAGGFFNVRLSGNGLAAITTHYDPVVLRVSPLDPLMTDVNATVAWSGSLSPTIKTDVGVRTLIGRASGETIQLCFEGDGFVVIQPYEEITEGKEEEEKKK